MGSRPRCLLSLPANLRRHGRGQTLCPEKREVSSGTLGSTLRPMLPSLHCKTPSTKHLRISWFILIRNVCPHVFFWYALKAQPGRCTSLTMMFPAGQRISLSSSTTEDQQNNARKKGLAVVDRPAHAERWEKEGAASKLLLVGGQKARSPLGTEGLREIPWIKADVNLPTRSMLLTKLSHSTSRLAVLPVPTATAGRARECVRRQGERGALSFTLTHVRRRSGHRR
jgi:hypothetical protein